jgi:hypothetical protein
MKDRPGTAAKLIVGVDAQRLLDFASQLKTTSSRQGKPV